MEVGAGTMCPETFLRVLGAETISRRVCSTQPPPGRRPLRRKSQPPVQAPAAPGDSEALARRRDRSISGSLEAIGIDLKKHDIKFEEDNWEAPTLGAWGIGWQVMLDGLEISQFTYFQQCGGIDLDLVPAELTYGLERISAFLQGVDSVYDIEWAPGVKYSRSAFRRRAAIFGLQLRDGRRRPRSGGFSTNMKLSASGCWACSQNIPIKSVSPCSRRMSRC